MCKTTQKDEIVENLARVIDMLKTLNFKPSPNNTFLNLICRETYRGVRKANISLDDINVFLEEEVSYLGYPLDFADIFNLNSKPETPRPLKEIIGRRYNYRLTFEFPEGELILDSDCSKKETGSILDCANNISRKTRREINSYGVMGEIDPNNKIDDFFTNPDLFEVHGRKLKVEGKLVTEEEIKKIYVRNNLGASWNYIKSLGEEYIVSCREVLPNGVIIETVTSYPLKEWREIVKPYLE
ncbi:MAG: hypothetical protein J7J15_00815 [Candidatus Aenigmarchaeota archaeon]|nr:hypothetical protein [Candidatus Aenigmarchaeota archaeon]